MPVSTLHLLIWGETGNVFICMKDCGIKLNGNRELFPCCVKVKIHI